MADDKTKRSPQDSSKVNVHEAYEVEYWTQKWGVSRAELEAAVKKVGTGAAAIAAELEK